MNNHDSFMFTSTILGPTALFKILIFQNIQHSSEENIPLPKMIFICHGEKIMGLYLQELKSREEKHFNKINYCFRLDLLFT